MWAKRYLYLLHGICHAGIHCLVYTMFIVGVLQLI